MIIVETKTEEAGKEDYVRPELAKHNVLHALTGASGFIFRGCGGPDIHCE